MTEKNEGKRQLHRSEIIHAHITGLKNGISSGYVILLGLSLNIGAFRAISTMLITTLLCDGTIIMSHYCFYSNVLRCYDPLEWNILGTSWVLNHTMCSFLDLICLATTCLFTASSV